MNTAAALRQYQAIKTDADAAGASPHRLIQMLFEGALERIALARGCLARGDIGARGEAISKAIAIVGGLRDGLDLGAGGELAANLDALYDYAQRRLMEAHRGADAAMLDEVAGLLGEIKSAWDAIA